MADVKNIHSIKIGAQVLLENQMSIIEGKKIGIITNHSSLLPDGRRLIDILVQNKNVDVIALFGPEHGIRGNSPDGILVGHEVDPVTSIKIFSLYGENKKPTSEMLKDIEILIFDIQDIGARFYTFISTMLLSMEAASENNIKYIVLDRPNPINGKIIEGPVMQYPYKSFVGCCEIPIRYGMTMGELALMINEEGWMRNNKKVDLTVIHLEGWNRSFWYDKIFSRWIKPSPNIPSLKSAIVYPGTCLIEGSNVSEGRGTKNPFEYIGAPFINPIVLAREMNGYNLKGVEFEPISFIPKSISGAAHAPKYEKKLCQGIQIIVINRDEFESVKCAIYILYSLKILYSDFLEWRIPDKNTGKFYLDLLAGTSRLREMLDSMEYPYNIYKELNSGLNEFLSLRNKYISYL